MARSKSYTLLTPDIIDELKDLQVKTGKKTNQRDGKKDWSRMFPAMSGFQFGGA